MYYNDHPPAHFHAHYNDEEAVIGIETGELIAGRLSPRALGLVQEWREMNRDELLEDWRRARDHRKLEPIAPLV